jgi:predicted unusual protein kinase regulating ubiquinone biosynthesis (AarF/ABC1/UbiB family)
MNEGRFRRLARIGGLTSRMTGHGIRERLFGKSSQADAARDLAESLSQLKGAAMKVGQQVALMASAMDLPDDVQRALRKLEKDAEPVPWWTIEQILERELDDHPDDIFATFEREPLGTASLAQAHAATLLDGTRVVVKVLHPGVLESLDADLLALRAILAGGRLVGRKEAELKGIMTEVEARLREEVDYLNEAANLEAFSSLYRGDPRVTMPAPHVDFCTRRVLVLDRVEGVHLETFVATATREQRQKAGMALAELFFEMAFVHRLLHADPHPGNYLFREDGTLGLLDFGCVKRFDEFFMGSYAKTALYALDGDRERTLQAAKDLGVWTGDTPEAGQAIWDFCTVALEPWKEGPCVLGHGENLIQRTRAVSEEIWKYPEVMGVPDMVFLHRTLAGLYTMARTLEVEADWAAMLRRYLTHAVDVAEGRA